MTTARFSISITLLSLAAWTRAPVNSAPPVAAPEPASRASAPAPVAPSDALPTRLSDAEFRKLQADISEPGGYFQIRDNFTSNEMEVGALFAKTYARVADQLFNPHGFTFTADEQETLKYVYNAFYTFGPSIATRGFTNGRGGASRAAFVVRGEPSDPQIAA